MLLRPNGGWSFAFDPTLDPRTAPALWHPDASPAVLVLAPTAAPPAAVALTVDHLQPIAIGLRPPDEEHFVADDDRGRHRLLRKHPSATGHALTLPIDGAMAIRLDAAARLTGVATGAQVYQPTALQRIRLTLLLRLLDAESVGLSRREIAQRLIYPHIASLHGATWKASAERRRTYRLCQEAARLRDQGFADLLLGRLRPPG